MHDPKLFQSWEQHPKRVKKGGNLEVGSGNAAFDKLRRAKSENKEGGKIEGERLRRWEGEKLRR